MTPTSVAYKGLSVDPRSMQRRKYFPTPPNWVRHEFVIPNDCIIGNEQSAGAASRIDNWLYENIHGCWTLNTFHNSNISKVIIGFEKLNDAVMFRMMDGETAWIDSER